MPTTTTTREEQLAAKAARARARKKAQRLGKIELAYKPIEDWDLEELARGRPRDKTGKFNGRAPVWVHRAVHEEAVRRFTELAQSDMRAIVPEAIAVVRLILENKEKDRRGRLVVAPSTKLDAAKWVIEHLVGKPTQRVETDISVKLQGILAECMVVPGDGDSRPAIDVESWSAEDEAEDDEDPGDG